MKRLGYLLWAIIWLVGCQGETPAALPTTLPTAPLTTPAPSPVAATSGPALALADAQPPIRLVIPALDFAVTVAPMAWQVSEVAGERRALWQVPLAGAGWHVNSAGAGGAGNVVISGHQRLGDAAFAPLARGQVKVGQQIILSDDQGRSFAYAVTKVSDPILALGETAADQAQASRYLAPTPQAQLTLVTGWPDFSDTHRIFVVAQFLGAVGQP